MGQFVNIDDIEVIIVLLSEIGGNEILSGIVCLKTRVETGFEMLEN